MPDVVLAFKIVVLINPLCDSDDCESLFMGANFALSFTAFVWTAILGLNGGNKPLKFPERLVMGSCSIAKWIFNYTQGMEWADNCNIQSMKTDQPCNVTAAREEFNKNGGYFYDASACCYDMADPMCYQKGVEYNKQVYPALHQQAQWDAWKPFMIAAPAILAVQLGYIGGKKLRRYMRQRQQQPFSVAADQPLLVETKMEEV